MAFFTKLFTVDALLTKSANTFFTKMQCFAHCLHKLLSPKNSTELPSQKKWQHTFSLIASLMCPKPCLSTGICLAVINARLLCDFNETTSMNLSKNYNTAAHGKTCLGTDRGSCWSVWESLDAALTQRVTLPSTPGPPTIHRQRRRKLEALSADRTSSIPSPTSRRQIFHISQDFHKVSN